jgi:hypothetical protein
VGWDRATLYAAGLLLGEHTSLMMMGCGPAAETAGLEALLPLTEGAPATPEWAALVWPDAMTARRQLGVTAAVDTSYELTLVLLVHALLRPVATTESI